MRRGFVGFVLLLFVGLLLPIGGFAEPLPIDSSPQFRDTAQDPHGNLHMLWVAQDGLNSSLLYQVKDTAGRTLAGPMVIAKSSARIRRPQLALDGRNIVHLLWQERFVNQTGQDTAIRYATLKLAPTGVATILLHPVTINHDQAATHPSLAVDQAGWAYAAWEIEGQDVVLTAIDPSGRIGQIRRITNHDTKTDHALPAVAVDRLGNVHVGWSAQSGDTTQIVYKALRGHDGQILEKERIVYTTRGFVDQAKVLTFDPAGNVKISWVSSPGRQAGQEGRLARLGARVGSGYVLLRSGHASAARVVATVVDQSITPVPGPVWSVAGSAVVTPKPRLDAPASTATRVAMLSPRRVTVSHADPSISKRLTERLLRYSTWSAAPPSVQGNTALPPLVSDSSALSDRSLNVVTAASVSALFRYHANFHARQLFPLTQGGDQIA
jgi:hypothetical protein